MNNAIYQKRKLVYILKYNGLCQIWPKISVSQMSRLVIEIARLGLRNN